MNDYCFYCGHYIRHAREDGRCENCLRPIIFAEDDAPLYALVRLDEKTEQETQIMTSHDHASLRAMADRGNTAYPGLLRYDVALADDLRPQAAP